MSEEDRDKETVKLPGGFEVRRRFSRGVLRSLPGHTPAEITMTVDMSDVDNPKVWAIMINPFIGGDPFGDAELETLSDLIDARDGILGVEAQVTTPDRGYTMVDVSATSSSEELYGVELRDYAAAQRAVKSARRRRQVTPELLARVLDLYDEGGIQAVMDGTSYSESYAFKLLRKARQEAPA